MINLGAIFITAAAFVLLVLTNLSAVTYKAIDLVHLDAASGGGHVELGVYGACYYDGSDGGSHCTKTLGYNLNPGYLPTAPPPDDLANILPHALTTALVLNIIACAFVGLVFLFAVFSALIIDDYAGETNSGGALLYCLGWIYTLARLLTWAAFFVDLAFVLVVRERVHDKVEGYSGHIGRAFWITFGAALSMSIICNCGC